jgi:hypothetical protein
MKTLLSLILLIGSLTSFAQDSYHLEYKYECLEGESCLINQKSDFLIKTIPVEDYDGVVVGKRLSSRSNIADTLHQKSQYCFQGKPNDICDMLNLMAYDDGHASITGFSCNTVNGKIDVRFEVYYDMGAGIDQLGFLLQKCE